MSQFLFLQEVADDAKARVIMEEDHQAKAILEEFLKGTSVASADPADDLFAIHNMMLPGRRLTRSSAFKDGKQLVVTPPKKKQLIWDVMPLFNDPVMSPVRP
jgi:hypothetical protein